MLQTSRKSSAEACHVVQAGDEAWYKRPDHAGLGDRGGAIGTTLGTTSAGMARRNLRKSLERKLQSHATFFFLGARAARPIDLRKQGARGRRVIV